MQYRIAWEYKTGIINYSEWQNLKPQSFIKAWVADSNSNPFISNTWIEYR